MMMIAAGHEDAIDANALCSDPIFKMALERAPEARDLCSQSTVSRLETLPDRRMAHTRSRGARLTAHRPRRRDEDPHRHSPAKRLPRRTPDAPAARMPPAHGADLTTAPTDVPARRPQPQNSSQPNRDAEPSASSGMRPRPLHRQNPPGPAISERCGA